MTAVRHHRKDLMIEARFLPDSLDEAKQLRDLIRETIATGAVDVVSARNAESTADSIIGWLLGKTDGVDGLTAPTRSRYRKVLAVLEAQVPPGPGERGRAGSPGIAGVLASLAGAAALAPVAPAAAVAALCLVPIVYDDRDDGYVADDGDELLEARAA